MNTDLFFKGKVMHAFTILRPISDNLKQIKSKGSSYSGSEREILFMRWVGLTSVAVNYFIDKIVPISSFHFPDQSLALLTDLVRQIIGKELIVSVTRFEYVLDAFIDLIDVLLRYGEKNTLLAKIETEHSETLAADTILAINQLNKVLNQTHHE